MFGLIILNYRQDEFYIINGSIKQLIPKPQTGGGNSCQKEVNEYYITFFVQTQKLISFYDRFFSRMLRTFG